MAKNKKFLELLKKQDLKLTRLADKLGVSTRIIHYWIIGRNRPSMIHVLAMAKMFGMKIESLWAIFKE